MYFHSIVLIDSYSQYNQVPLAGPRNCRGPRGPRECPCPTSRPHQALVAPESLLPALTCYSHSYCRHVVVAGGGGRKGKREATVANSGFSRSQKKSWCPTVRPRACCAVQTCGLHHSTLFSTPPWGPISGSGEYQRVPPALYFLHIFLSPALPLFL